MKQLFLLLSIQALFAAYPEVDYFTRINNTDVGPNWTCTGSGFDIASRELRSLSSNNNNMCGWTAGSAPNADQYSLALATNWNGRSGNATGGVGIRLDAASENGYSCMIVAGNGGVRNLKISRWDSGVETHLESNVPAVVSFGDSILVGWVVGTTIHCHLKTTAGVTIIAEITATDSTYSSGRPGIVRGSSSTGISWPYWWGGNGVGDDMFVTPTAAGEFYVSASATSHNATGTITDPWPYLDFFADQTRLLAGSTLWFRGGTYNPARSVYDEGSSFFEFTQSGTSGNEMKYNSFPGESVVFDAALPCSGNSGYAMWIVTGDYSIFDGGYHGWRMTNSDTTCKVITQCGSNPTPNPLRAMTNQADFATYRHLVWHDFGDGLGGGAINSKQMNFTGLLSFNMGWNAPDRGHGHGAYLHNIDYATHRNTLQASYFIRNLATEAKIFSQSGGDIGNWLIDSTAFVVAGTVETIFLTQGGNPVNMTFNKTYMYKGQPRINIDQNLASGFVMTNNIWDGGFDMYLSDNSTMTNNVFSRHANPDGNYWYIARAATGGTTYAALWNPIADYNTYYNARASGVNFAYLGGAYSLANLQSMSGETNSTYNSANFPASDIAAGPSSTNYTSVLPDPVQPGTGNVIIYNWKNNSSVSVNVSSILSVGDPYEVIDLQNWTGGPVATGVYAGGSLSFDMTLTAFQAPVGSYGADPGSTCTAGSDGGVPATHPVTSFAHTSSNFGSFMVRRRQVYRQVQVNAHNPFSAATQLKVESGPSAAVLNFPIQTVACSSGAVCKVPVSTQMTGNTYYKLTYLTAGNAVVSQSDAIRVLVN